jgi:regulator of sigma E protease
MDVVSILLAIVALGFLIVVHEAGHYVVARWCKMRVERFSIGFGPGILKRKAKSGTIFQLAPLPFGGFVEIRGMNIAEEIDPEDVHAYPNRPAWQRFLTILAGPATNYISAIFLAFGLYAIHGQPGDTYYVAEVTKDSGADGKLLPNDRILTVNGQPMFAPGSTKLSEAVNAKQDKPVNVKEGAAGKPVEVTVLRNEVPITVSITPKFSKNDKARTEGYLLGVKQAPDIVPVPITKAIGDALAYPVEQTKLILGGLRDIFTGKEEADPGGPVRIVSEFKSAFSRGIADGILLLMMLSVYLGLFNLFPLPALDGGRLVFLLYEMVTRRRANPKIETMVHMGGIMVLLVVMVLVTLHDFKVF